MNTPASATVPLDLLRQLVPAAEKLGLDLPGVVRFAPQVDLSQGIRALALELGRLVARQDIYLMHGQIVTVNAKLGAWEPMTATRFTGWVEEWCTFKSPGRSARMRESLSREEATLILDQDIFKACLRPLRSVNKVVLPVRRASGALEWLPPGYDEESQTFTVDLLPYARDWPVEKGKDWFREHCCDYPWSMSEGKEDQPLEECRSYCVHVGAMVGVYCRLLFQEGALRPMIAFLANQPGTGKSTLVSMILTPVFGIAAAADFSKDEEALRKELDTAASTGQAYVFFDDIGSGMFSNLLNKFITEPARRFRVMGGNQEMAEHANIWQVFSTGNDVKISPDLMRRALVAELFLAGEVKGRKFERKITPKYLQRPEVRAGFLSACCALVRNYVETVEALRAGGAAAPTGSTLESFEEWTGEVSMILQFAGFSDPIAAPDLAVGGAEEEDEVRQLLILAASEEDDDCRITREELVDLARKNDLLENVIGSKDDKPPDPSQNKRFGLRLKKWRGRQLRDSKGRLFEFGHKRMPKGTTYPVKFLTEKK